MFITGDVKFIASDDATTCHIIVLIQPGELIESYCIMTSFIEYTFSPTDTVVR